MKWIESIGKVLETLGVVVLALTLVVAPFYLPTVITANFTVAPELAIVVLGWVFVLLTGLGRALQGLPVLSSGGRSVARWLSLALAGWVIVTTFIGYLPTASLGYLWTVITYFAVAQGVLSWLDARPGRYRTLLAILGVLLAMQVVVGLAQVGKLPMGAWAVALEAGSMPGRELLRDVFLTLDSGAKTGSAVGTLGNVNFLAELMVLILPVAVGWALTVRRRWQQVAVAIGLVLGFSVLLATSARGAMLGLLLVAPFAAWGAFGGRRLDPRLWFQSARRKWLGAAGALVGLGVLAMVGGGFLSKLAKIGAGDISITSRLIHWQAAFSMWLERPIVGTGLGNFKMLITSKLQALYPQGVPGGSMEARFLQLHNEPLQILVELGIVGLVLAALAMFFWVRETRANDQLPAPVRFGLLWGVGALGVAGCFGFPLHIPLTAFVLAMVLCLGISRPAEQQEETLAPVWRPVYAIAVFAVVGGMGWMAIERGVTPLYAAHRYEFVGESLRKVKDHAHVADIYGVAARLHRFKGNLRWHELQALVRQKEFDRALALYEASEMDGLAAPACFWKAFALQGKGQLAEALPLYERAVIYSGNDSTLRRRSERQIDEIKGILGAPKSGTTEKIPVLAK